MCLFRREPVAWKGGELLMDDDAFIGRGAECRWVWPWEADGVLR